MTAQLRRHGQAAHRGKERLIEKTDTDNECDRAVVQSGPDGNWREGKSLRARRGIPDGEFGQGNRSSTCEIHIQFDGMLQQLAAAAQSQFFLDMRLVGFDRFYAYVQFVSNLPRAAAGAD